MIEPMPGGRIRFLPPLLAQKIAAGEVIERPQSVVRELLDNAIDSGASEIDIYLREGGNSLLVVQDNGSGMDRPDLEMCWLPHATSKIHEEPDLQTIRTMGFRGEALSSIAAVSRLSVFSATAATGAVLEVHGGQRQKLDAWAGRQGTRVEVANLFYNLPARLQFLKRAGSEFLLCKTTLLEKAMTHPGISFRLFNEDKLVLFLPVQMGEQALRNRLIDCFRSQLISPDSLHQISAVHAEAKVTLVLGRPDNYQHDRKLIQIFINRRRINEYSLQQAVELGYAGFLPGGRFPVAAVHLEIDPARVDVNIHPAKREVKMLDKNRLHSLVVRMVQDFLRIDHHRQVIRPENAFSGSRDLPGFESHHSQSSISNYELRTRFTLPAEVMDRPSSEMMQSTAPFSAVIPPPLSDPKPTSQGIRYIGQVFGVFLVAQLGEELILLDFHAAHERILFDRYRANNAQQRLLVPIILHVQDDESGGIALEHCREALQSRGIAVKKASDDGWLLEAVPLCFSGDTELLVEALESGELEMENLDRRLFATLACRAARKDGDFVSADQARDLLEAAMQLPEKRCPHGRPIFFSLSRNELFELVGRKV